MQTRPIRARWPEEKAREARRLVAGAWIVAK